MRKLACCAALAVVATTPASATESTIVRGVGIGKIRVGMTRAQVGRVFGNGAVVNARAKIGASDYVQLAWNFGTQSVGFLKHGPTYRVTEVATSLRGQRTTAGIG